MNDDNLINGTEENPNLLLQDFSSYLSAPLLTMLKECFWIVEEKEDETKKYQDVLPMRQALSIKYNDSNEIMDVFIEKLYNTILYFVKGKEQFDQTEISTIIKKSHDTFRGRHSNSNDTKLVQGQLGELLLWYFIEYFHEAIPVVRKQEIIEYGNDKQERKGSDAIHVRYNKDISKYQFFFGESKLYKSFNAGFKDGIDSIIEHYPKIFKEMSHYTYANQTVNKDLQKIASLILNGGINDIEYEKHFVFLLSITGHTIKDRSSPETIKQEISQVLHNHYDKFRTPKSNQNFHEKWNNIVKTKKIPPNDDHCEPTKFHFVFLVIEQWEKFLKLFYKELTGNELKYTEEPENEH